MPNDYLNSLPVGICVSKKNFLPSHTVEESPADGRKKLNLNLTPEAYQIVGYIKADTGIAQQTAVSRILEWFASQEDDVRAAILTGAFDPGELLMRHRMIKMAESGQNIEAMTVEQAAHLIKLATARLEQMGKDYRYQLEGKRRK